MQRSTGLVHVDEVYVTHLHADHYLGIPGLMKTYDLQDRRRPLRIVGPPGLGDLFTALRRVFGRISYDVELVELGEGEALRHAGYEVRCFPVEHRMTAYGYALVEDERPGRFDPETAEALGVKPGPDFGRLQDGESVPGRDGPVRPEQVMGEARRGRKVVITGDTAPCEMTRVAAHEAELLVHDGSFADAELERARETGHSTARQAGELARETGVKLLALVHVSSRYEVREVLGRQQDRVFDAQRGLGDAHLIQAQRGVALSPHDPDGIRVPGEALPEKALLVLAELEATHDAQERATAVLALQQVVVGEHLGKRDARAVCDPLQVEEPGHHPPVQRGEPQPADAANGERGHRPRTLEVGYAGDRVQDGEREDPLGSANRPLEPDRAADVMDDEVTAVDPQGVDRLPGPAGEAGPRVVEVHGAVCQAEAGEIEGDRAQPLLGEGRDHL